MKEGVSSFPATAGIPTKQLEVIYVSIFARREELRAVMTELVLRQTEDKHLVDYNYNIEVSS